MTGINYHSFFLFIWFTLLALFFFLMNCLTFNRSVLQSVHTTNHLITSRSVGAYKKGDYQLLEGRIQILFSCKSLQNVMQLSILQGSFKMHLFILTILQEKEIAQRKQVTKQLCRLHVMTLQIEELSSKFKYANSYSRLFIILLLK